VTSFLEVRPADTYYQINKEHPEQTARPAKNSVGQIKHNPGKTGSQGQKNIKANQLESIQKFHVPLEKKTKTRIRQANHQKHNGKNVNTEEQNHDGIYFI
jgi:Rieske Fe-S protein